ncbi:putative monooxygenase [Dictyobacter alpinus]|uniref:Putative monooxygenase n=2 Tax=Dictyobacter alpinus TaxID=2014873 RepID=A0A402BDC5_9CHLR|nr:putative monooxygenase [Dictyobacter alpinus]
MEYLSNPRPPQERIGMMIWPTDPLSLVNTLVNVEEAGVRQVWLPVGWAGNPDLLTTLAAAAERTSRLIFGTAIIQVFSRHPVLLATQALSLYSLAPNRLRLGVGVGTTELAKSIYGVEMESQLSYLREYLQVLIPLLQQGDIHHQGHFFSADLSFPTPAPIPVLIAALGPATFRLAGEMADGILPFLCPIPYLLDTALPALSAGAASVGRTRPPIVAHVPVALTENREAALKAGRKGLGFYIKSPFYRKMLVKAGFSIQEVDAVADTLLEKLLVYGNISQIKEHLLEILHEGIDELVIGPVSVSDEVRETTQLAQMVGQL